MNVDVAKIVSRRMLLLTAVLLLLLHGAAAARADEWVEIQKLTASDGADWDVFGASVAISGDRAIVTAPNIGASSGSAYVFERDAGGTWVEVQKLTASDAGDQDQFGSSVSLVGDRAVVGALLDDDKGEHSGSAYVFERDAGGTWVEVQKLTASDGEAGDLFGEAVSLSGDRAIVGAPHHDDKGSAYVFERDAGGTWVEVQKLTAGDGEAGDGFGGSFVASSAWVSGEPISLSGDRAIVGAFHDDDKGEQSGSAYVFERDAGGSWVEVQKLTASDGEAGDAFGASVSLSGDWAIVGAHGADTVRGSAYVFQRDALGNWIEVQKMTGDAKQHDGFGVWVSLDGSLDGGAIVGAALDDDNGTQSGSACVFQRHSDGTWYQTHKLTASDAMEGDYFGKSVLSGDRAIVGATGDDDKGVLSGSAYVFERPLFQFNKKFVCSIAKCGPDLNFDGVTDHVVEVKSHTSTEYLVGITFRNPLRAPALIEELVPREWEVVSYSAAKREDLVLVAPDGNRGFKGYRATRIQWFPTGNDSSLVYTLRLRKHDARRYLPADCGCLRLPGASALDTNGLRRLLDNDGKPLVSNALAVAAVSDVNRDGTIDYTGNGDEDGDGLTDLREACELGTNPCKADTDGDGTPDAVDRASLDGCIR